MEIIVEEIKFKNFDDEDDYFILICLEKFYENEANYARSFIAFERNSLDEQETFSYIDGKSIHEIINIKEKTLAIIKEKEDEIHEALGNMQKIEKIIDNDHIKVTAYTSAYWEDVRLYMHSSRFNYATDVLDTAAIEAEIARFIKKNYYAKDLFIQNCEDGKMNEAIGLLHKSKFKEEDLQDMLERNPKAKKIFELHNLHELLIETLPNNENNKDRKFKI
jgi:hypothetical protein